MAKSIAALCDAITEDSTPSVRNILILLYKKICDLGTAIQPIEGKEFIDFISASLKSNPKEILTLALYRDKVTCLPCLFDCDDINLENPLNIKLYNMNLTGVPVEDIFDNYTPFKFEYCPPAGLNGTLQDVIDFIVASGLTLPDGSAPDGVVNLIIEQEYKGQKCAGSTTTAVGTEIGTAPYLCTLDGGQPWIFKAQKKDEDCDGRADYCADPTTPVVIPPGAGVVLKGELVLCDTDPTDPAV